MKKLFGERLKKLRLASGETQSELANYLNVGKSMISLWENGINYPEVKKLIELAEYYQVSTDFLLGLDNNDKSNSYNNYGIHTGDVKF